MYTIIVRIDYHNLLIYISKAKGAKSMSELGMIVSTYNNIARVQIAGASGCGSTCGSCNGCAAASSTLVEAENKIGAKAGQQVTIDRDRSAYIKSALLVFGFPILMLFIGVIIGSVAAGILNTNLSETLLGGLVGIIFWIVSYMIIKLIDKKFNLSNRIKYVVISVIE
jgi:sigma-E factor negative regulatory protein RseC